MIFSVSIFFFVSWIRNLGYWHLVLAPSSLEIHTLITSRTYASQRPGSCQWNTCLRRRLKSSSFFFLRIRLNHISLLLSFIQLNRSLFRYGCLSKCWEDYTNWANPWSQLFPHTEQSCNGIILDFFLSFCSTHVYW